MAIAGLSASIYLDHNVDPRLARDLRGHGFDAVAAIEVDLRKATDDQHLRFATAQGRVLITHDLKDIPLLAEAWFLDGEIHSGIVLCEQPPNVPYGELLRRLLSLLDSRTKDEFVGEVIWLTRAL